MKRILTLILALILVLATLTSCSMSEIADIIHGIMAELPDASDPSETPDDPTKPDTPDTPDTPDDKDWSETYNIITVAEALQIAEKFGDNDPTDRYYIRGIIKTVSNAAYGEMIIADETGEIYVYGTYNEDGSVQYPGFEEKPLKGDEVLLSCTLNTHNGEPQVKNARLIDFISHQEDVDVSAYTKATIAEAREADAGEKLLISGVVARITYANGMIPSGVIIVDGRDSIYVYDGDLAAQVSIGNKIEVAGSKAYWILDSEKNNAEKFGYKGCNQLESAILVSNDKGDHQWITDDIQALTVKELLDMPVTEDVTTQVYKVNALVKKVPATGYVNYYFFDLDGETGAYTYTQCNGKDFAWLDQFDGKICTVYITALNAKSTASDCYFRFLPVEVVDEGYKFNTDDAAKFAVQYHGVTQFDSSYSGAKTLVVATTVSSDLLGFTGATLTYSSSNENVIKFVEVDGVLTMSCLSSGQATITVKGEFGGKEYSETVVVTVEFPTEEVESLTVGEAINAAVGTEVVVKGIVGPSLVNKTGFYLIDETGVIAIQMEADVLATLELGNEVILKGTRDLKTDAGASYFGQTNIKDCTVVVNNYGSHKYSTATFIEGKTLDYVRNLNVAEDHGTEVYIVKATVKVVETQFYTNIQLIDGNVSITLYCSSASQYSWLKAYADQEVTVELAPCHWNNKSYYAGCVLAVIEADGDKVCNTLNFNN